MVSDGAGLVAGLAGTGVVEGDASAVCDPLVRGGPSGGDSVDWHAAAMTSTAKPTALGRIFEGYTTTSVTRFRCCCDTRPVREEPVRIAGRLEGTLRIPDTAPRGSVVVAHPLPTHGGTMRNPLVAALARAVAERGFYALRFNFRSVGASAGEWTGGAEEWRDVGDAVAHARAVVPGLPVGLAAYSFGAVMSLGWIAEGGRVEGLALVGLPLRSVSLDRQALPRVPDGTFIVAAENDQFGTAAELRAEYPSARIASVAGVDHFFVGKRDEVGRLVADELLRTLASTVPNT